MLFLAAALPILFWNGGPDSATALREAGIERVAVPAGQATGWGTGVSVEAFDPAKAVKLATPSVEYRANEATASRSPWLDANGWTLLRRPRLFPLAITLAIYGFHFRQVIERHVS